MFPVKFWEREKKPESSVLRVPAFLIGNVSEHKKTVKPMASPFCCFGLFSGFFFCFRCFSSRSFCFGSSSGSSRSLTCDNAFRAFVCTDTARFTFAVIDYCHVVDYMDCIERTVLFTDLTCDTTCGANLHYILTNIFGRALYFYFLLSRQQFDDVFRASRYAFTTSYTFIFIYYCNAIDDFDCTESTSFFTAAQTQTAICAALSAAASQLYSHVTVVNTKVVVFHFCCFTSTTAFYECSYGFGSCCFDTHDGTYFFCYCSAANGAGIYRSRTSSDCSSTTAATREATATAVRAGQYFQNFTDLGIFVYFEDLAGNAKACTKNNTKATDTQDRIYNIHNVHFCHTPCITV